MPGAIAVVVLATAPALAICPDAPLTGPVFVTYGDRISQVDRLPDGTTADRETALDGSFAVDYVTHPLGLVLSAQQLEGGRVLPETVETVAYEGMPLPDPAPGARWQGREVSRFADGRVTAYATEASMGQPEAYRIGDCVLEVLPVVVTRVEDGLPGADAEAYIYLPDLGIVLFMGYAAVGEETVIDPPLAFSTVAPAGLHE